MSKDCADTQTCCVMPTTRQHGKKSRTNLIYVLSDDDDFNEITRNSNNPSNKISAQLQSERQTAILYSSGAGLQDPQYHNQRVDLTEEEKYFQNQIKLRNKMNRGRYNPNRSIAVGNTADNVVSTTVTMDAKQPIRRGRGKKKIVEPQIPDRPDPETMNAILSHNKHLYNAMVTSNVKEMLEYACSHIRNTQNLELMEWSECVFIQLCTLHTRIDFDNYVWSTLLDFVLRYEWSMELYVNLKNLDRDSTLSRILIENRKFKNSQHPMVDKVFISKPFINYGLLSTFVVTSNSLCCVVSNNSLFRTTRKKKKTVPELSIAERLDAIKAENLLAEEARKAKLTAKAPST